MATEYRVLLTDDALRYVSDEITGWESIDITLKFNEPSSGLFTIPAYPWITAQLPRPASPGDLGVPSRRVVIIRNLGAEYGYQQSILIAGPVETWKIERADDGQNAGVGMLTVHFADDLARVVARSAYPNPAQTPAAQTTDRWSYTGNAELALRALVDANAGPGALPPRRVPQLALGAVQNIGTNVVVATQRMEPIGDVMRAIADLGGKLGFRTRQVGTQIQFEVYQPPDKSGSVRFSFGLGNVKYLSVETKSPTATTAIVGGQGEGADRNLLERTNSTDETAWGRFEKLVSRPGNTAVQQLTDDGDKALADGAATVRATSNVSDIPDQRYGVAYNLGDKVAVETSPGKQTAELITSVHIQAFNAAGDYVSPTVGSQAAKSDPIWTQRLREIEDRLNRVERSVKPAVLPP